jgi:hypothetical protein
VAGGSELLKNQPMKKILLFAFASGLLASAPAHAFNPQPDPPGDYGFVGISVNETLRFNVSNISGETRTSPPDPCRVEVTFVDAAGTELLPAVQTTLAPGQSTSVDLNGASLLGSVTGTNSITSDSAILRTEVRPVVRIIPSATTRLPAGPCVSTFELIDNRTGKTLLTSGPQNPGTIYEFNPQPDPPGKTFGLVGLVPGQTIRLTAVNIVAPDRFSSPPDPCRVTFSLLGVDGIVVQSSSQILNPGQGTFLDLPLAAAVTTADANPVDAVPSQLQLRGIVTVESLRKAEPPDPCITSLEVFDSATGRTSTLLWPQKVRR